MSLVKASLRAIGDVLLVAFAVGVMVASALVIQRSDSPSERSTLSQGRPVVGAHVTPIQTHSPQVSPPTSPSPSADPSDGPAALVVAGPDLARLGSDLVAASGETVLVAESSGQQVLADGALEGIDQRPSAVVIQVLAGSKTSVRTTDAIDAIHKRWAGVRVLVIGPFGAADRKSAAAVKAAAEAAQVTFLDPVELTWRADDTPAGVSESDFSTVASKIAAALR